MENRWVGQLKIAQAKRTAISPSLDALPRLEAEPRYDPCPSMLYIRVPNTTSVVLKVMSLFVGVMVVNVKYRNNCVLSVDMRLAMRCCSLCIRPCDVQVLCVSLRGFVL